MNVFPEAQTWTRYVNGTPRGPICYIRRDRWEIRAVERTNGDTGEPAGYWVVLPPAEARVCKVRLGDGLDYMAVFAFAGRTKRLSRWQTAESAMKAIDKKYPLNQTQGDPTCD